MFFWHFLKFGSLVFPQIAQDDSLEQCLTTSRGKTHEKNFGHPKLGPKSSSIVFLDITQDCSLRQYLTSSRAETSKKNLRSRLGPNRPKSGPKWGFPAFSSYLIKRGKILLNWYFISVDYIEFISSIIRCFLL